jgi:hypothetical protein
VPGKTMALALAVSVEVEGVVLGRVLMSWQAVLTAAGFAKPPWVLFLPAEENICVILEDVEVCCSQRVEHKHENCQSHLGILAASQRPHMR